MTNKAINIVRSFVREYLPTVDVYDGPFYDIYIKAFGFLYKDVIEDINGNSSVESRLDIRNYATMTRDQLARIGASNFVPVNNGSFASTIMTIEMSRPAQSDFPAGTEFGTTTGLRYYSSKAVSFSSAQLADRQVGNVFSMKIPVTAAKTGSEYQVAAGVINTLVSSISAPILRVYNSAAAIGGTNQETNIEYYFRMVRSINTRDLLITDASIISTIEGAFPSVRRVTVAGKGDPMMQRDRVYDSFAPDGLSPYEKSGYFGKRAGTKKFNKNMAYSGRLDSATPGTLTEIEDSVVEVTQQDYYDLFALDVQYMVVRAGLEFGDDFETYNAGVEYYKDGWIFSDSGLPFGKKKYGDSVRISGGYLCLGAEEAVTFAPVEV